MPQNPFAKLSSVCNRKKMKERYILNDNSSIKIPPAINFNILNLHLVCNYSFQSLKVVSAVSSCTTECIRVVMNIFMLFQYKWLVDDNLLAITL